MTGLVRSWSARNHGCAIMSKRVDFAVKAAMPSKTTTKTTQVTMKTKYLLRTKLPRITIEKLWWTLRFSILNVNHDFRFMEWNLIGLDSITVIQLCKKRWPPVTSMEVFVSTSRGWFCTSRGGNFSSSNFQTRWLDKNGHNNPRLHLFVKCHEMQNLPRGKWETNTSNGRCVVRHWFLHGYWRFFHTCRLFIWGQG